MLVDWRPRARRRLQGIYDHIEEQSPAAADFVFESIIAAAAALPDHPYVYPGGSKAKHAGNDCSAELHRRLSGEVGSHSDSKRVARAATLSLVTGQITALTERHP
jgi:plasmid stabilization system protein ParE